MNRDDILEYTGADRWEWIEATFVGLTVGEIEDKMHRIFGWEDTCRLANAIHEELDATIMSEETARELGYEITEGAYVGTQDDRKGRWYIERIDAPYVRRLGRGFPTKVAALRYLTMKHGRVGI